MHSIILKLGGAFLLIVIICVSIMAFIANLNTKNSFQQFVSQSNASYVDMISLNLAQYYSNQQTWSGVQNILPDFTRTSSDRIVIADAAGKIVGDTENRWLGTTVSQIGIGNGTSITVSGTTVGEIYLLPVGMGMMGRGGQGNVITNTNSSGSIILSAAEQEFLSQVNRSLWITGIITAVIAILFSFFLAFQIIRPLRALTQGVRHISNGNLNYRVHVNSKDEIGELSKSFNAMANSLEKNEQSRRRLAADIAHELRTPLTIIEGTVDGIIDGIFPPDPDQLKSIKEQTALLTRLIEDLRDISLAESGQLKLSLSSTDIVDLVQRKLSQIESAAKDKDIRLNLNTPGSLPRLNIDTGRIEQVINNLLTNALRYTPNGGRITVSLESVFPGRLPQITLSGVLITVADSGIGIEPKYLPRVFERFFRVQDSRERAAGGTGLGLAIVKQMVEAHHGKVWVESEQGKGSQFYIFIPLE